jgi:hypothetical protein
MIGLIIYFTRIMQQLTERQAQCPYCGEIIDLLIDESEPEQNTLKTVRSAASLLLLIFLLTWKVS